MSRFYVSPKEGKRAHAGLLLDKYLDPDPKKAEWSEIAGRDLADPVYRRAYDRWESFWKRDAPEGRLILKGDVRGRLAMGLGAKGVLEVGLRLSQAYGTPLIPGSAIKGILCHVIEEKGLKTFLFGDEEHQGFVEFQDAWWVPESRSPLMLDVMTVHHPDYYTGSAAPSDSDNPNPVHFLSMRGTFLFVADAPNAAWRNYVEKLLIKTLEQRGVGAKTAAGYGRFVFKG